MKSNHTLGLNNFSSPWSGKYSSHFLFPIEDLENYLRSINWNDHKMWLNHWSKLPFSSLAHDTWPSKAKLDWFWGFALPFLSDVERLKLSGKHRPIFGISALPGSGKTTIGKWLSSASNQIGFPLTVISLDDFYLPYPYLDKVMSDNPWNVPRGLPGSHSIDMILEVIQKWQLEGVLYYPTFDKSLRGGLGSRSGWCISNPKGIVIEGWFLGCQPSSNIQRNSNETYPIFNPSLSPVEIEYRRKVQV